MLKKTVVIVLMLVIVFTLTFALPVSAQSDTLAFNLWSRYANRISFTTSTGQAVRQLVYDNTVTTGDGFTSISNAQPLNDDLDYPYFTSLALLVPSSSFTPQFYIKPQYAGKKYTMHVTLLCSSDQGTSSIINSITYNNFVNLLYTTSDTSQFIRGESSNINLKYINSYTFQLDYDVSFAIVKSTLIYGYHFEVQGLFDYNVNGEILDTYSFNVTYTLSDLVFSNDLTQEEIQNIINGSTDQIIENDNKNAQDTQNAINNASNNISNTIKDENERQENKTTSSGNDSIDIVTNAIPSDNEGFLAAIQTLSNSMSYDGTHASWNIPDIKVPAIEGVCGEIVLAKDLKINFEEYINMIPENILNVVRVICTIALVIFCAKELYGLIQEVMVNRRSAT